MRLALVGHPGHARVLAFQAALAQEGLPPAALIPWSAVVRDPRRALRGAEGALRIDSPGQHLGVAKALLALGHVEARAEGVEVLDPTEIRALRPERGRLVAPRQRHLGLLKALGGLEAAIDDRGIRVAPTPAEIRVLFDKRATSRRYRALGIPVPAPIDGVDGPEALRAAVAASPSGTVYVKLASGSSGAAIAAAALAPDGQLALATTVGRRPDGTRFNSRRLRTVTDPAEVDALLGYLLREGAQVEVGIRRAELDGVPFDLRVVAIGGAPVVVVGRQAPGPVSNLHIGGRRLDADTVRRRIGAERWDEVHALVEAVAAAHPGCLHLGVDVAVDQALARAYVLEANAFGDFFPGLAIDGRTLYRWELQAMMQGMG